MERCPICKARLKQVTICPRCGVDLTVPLQIADQAEWWLQYSITLLGQGHLTTARQSIEQALSLRQTPLARTLHNFLNSGLPLLSANTPPQENNPSTIPKVIILGYEAR